MTMDFDALFCLGLGLASAVRRSPWRLLLGGVGCLHCMCGLIVTTALVPSAVSVRRSDDLSAAASRTGFTVDPD
jgi:hypothetical protein